MNCFTSSPIQHHVYFLNDSPFGQWWRHREENFTIFVVFCFLPWFFLTWIQVTKSQVILNYMTLWPILAHFQTEAAETPLFPCDVWHKQLQIICCWAESEMIRVFVHAWRTAKHMRKSYLKPVCSVLINPQGSTAAFLPTHTHTHTHTNPFGYYVSGTKHLAQPLMC